ncbi:MAG: sporulation protein YabP [Ruminococcaceae bacterium]|nr:sporulation protein YabP [Oscillospiraceae bacterium]
MNGQEKTTLKDTHSLALADRHDMSISGVKEVTGFDETYVLLQTLCGELCIEGSQLRIGVLDTERGQVTLTGQIDAILYRSAEEGKRGLFGRRSR